MIKKQNTFYGAIGLIIGIVGGIAGTAFSLGADKQRVEGILTANTIAIAEIKVEEQSHKEATQQELDRFSEMITTQMVLVQNSIVRLTGTVSDLRTDVQVLKAIMERMENSINSKSDFN